LSKPPFLLEISDLHWLEGGDTRDDLCVHGSAHVRIGEETLVTPADGDGWTLSAGSLYLLRTLFRDHSSEDRVGDHLIPCCGFNMWVNEEGELFIVGCPSGIDWSVHHTTEGLSLEAPGGTVVVVDEGEWRRAVLTLADTVRAYYRSSPSRRLPAEDYARRGYELFWEEWRRLREAAA